MSEQNLKEMKDLMLFFGRIPETHIKTLQEAPYIYFDGAKASGITYDLDSKSDSWFVMYEFIVEKDFDEIDKRCKALEKAVRLLFWKEVVLIVNVNGKTIYKSKGLVPNE